MRSLATLVLAAALIVPVRASAQQDGTRVRLGIHGYGVSLDKDPEQGGKLGAGVEIQLTTLIIYGLGVRASFLGYYNKDEAGQLSWFPPDAENQAQTDEPRITVPSIVHNGLFSGTINAHWELERTGVRTLEVMQPYLGVGALLGALRKWSDITADEVYLLLNDMNDLDDPNNTDPWSIQFIPGLNLYGGFNFNIGTGFRISLEVGGMMFRAEEASLKKATETYDARHDEYRVRALKFGGGFSGRF
jgi:hypothetical protein